MPECISAFLLSILPLPPALWLIYFLYSSCHQGAATMAGSPLSLLTAGGAGVHSGFFFFLFLFPVLSKDLKLSSPAGRHLRRRMNTSARLLSPSVRGKFSSLSPFGRLVAGEGWRGGGGQEGGGREEGEWGGREGRKFRRPISNKEELARPAAALPPEAGRRNCCRLFPHRAGTEKVAKRNDVNK